MSTRFHRACLFAITLVLSACNDFEPAERLPTADDEVQPAFEASVAALTAAGVSVSNPQSVANAPDGQGFTLQAATLSYGGEHTSRQQSDDGQVITLAGGIEHAAQSVPQSTLWVQRLGEEALILNTGSPDAIVLLPRVQAPSTLRFGFIGLNGAGYVGEQVTTVNVLPTVAPFTVATAVQYPFAAQVALLVSLNAPMGETVTLRYSTRDGNAVAGEDYAETFGELTFEPGVLSRLVSVPLLGSVSDGGAVDKYFTLQVTGQVGPVKGTVHGYGVVLGNGPAGSVAPSVSDSTVAQDALFGSAGEQRVYLARPNTSLRLSLATSCAPLSDSNDCLSATDTPQFENANTWQNVVWPSRPASRNRYLLTNTSATALDYTAYIYDGETQQIITGQLAANSQIVLYTAFPELPQATSSSSVNSSSSSSSQAVVAHTLTINVAPQGLAATALVLTTQLNDDIPIAALSAALNGEVIESGPPLTVPYAQLLTGENTLTVVADDGRGQSVAHTLHVYLGAGEANTFIGRGATNIFIGQQGVDSFTGGDGRNIYLLGSGFTELISGSGQNRFIHQVGVPSMNLEAQGSASDDIILPTASLASARVRQSGELSFYLEAGQSELDLQTFNVQQFFNADGSVQSSIQRIEFADGVLTAADIRQLIHTAMPGDSAYWGFSGDDTLIDTDGNDVAFGGAGNDTITVNAYAEGGDGNDVITALHGVGGNGDDEIHAINNATGGDGNDILFTEDFADGGLGNDILHGNDNPNQLFGGLGDDTLYGYGGDDALFGDEGNNTFYGGDGDDKLFAAQGEFNDILFGGNGNDNLWGYDGDNYFDGGAGDEVFFTGHGNNTVICGEGNHEFYGSDEGNDTITCGSGIDSLFLEGGNDDVDSGDGNDALYGGSGNKLINAGGGDDEIRISGGDDCTVAAGAGDDIVYVSCQRLTVTGDAGADSMVVAGSQQLEVSGGLGDDLIQLDGRPYSDPLLLEQPYTHIFWSPGDGNDIYTIRGYSLTGAIDNSVFTKSDNTQFNSRAAENTHLATTGVSTLGLPSTHFYLGGGATLENIRFEQADATSLLMHYHDTTTDLNETLTFNYWFDSDTLQSHDEQFYDFVLPDLSTISTASIREHFNAFYYQNFDDDRISLLPVGAPIGSDKTVVAGTSLLVDFNNYVTRDALTLSAADWTIEFWVALPETLQATTPILQWGEAAYGSDGIGLALVNTGESFYWSLMNGEANEITHAAFDPSGAPQHIAIVSQNHRLTLYVNGQPSATALAPEFDASIARPLALGYYNFPSALTNTDPTRWYIDELLIHYQSAKYSIPFIPPAESFNTGYVPM